MRYEYEVELPGWRLEEPACTVEDSEAGRLEVAPPPEFGGPGGAWSPEALLVASIVSCKASTLRFFLRKRKVPVEAFSVRGRGVMEKTSEGLRFTSFEVTMRLRVREGKRPSGEELDTLKELVEKYCPVSAAVTPRAAVVLELESAPDGGGTGTGRNE